MRVTMGVAIVVVAAACGGTGSQEPAVDTAADTAPTTPSSAATSTTATSPSSTSTTTTVVPAEPAIDWMYDDPANLAVTRLLDPGAEPHEVRRYSPEAGVSEELRFVLDFALDQTIDDIDIALEMQIAMVATFEILEHTDRGFVVQATYDSVTATADNAGSQSALDAVYDGFAGLVVHQLTTDTGLTIATHGFDDLPGENPFESGLGGAVIPLPSEPFGVGAVWESTGTIVSNGIELVQTSTVTVAEIDGPLLTIDVDIAQDFGPDGLTIPGLEYADVDADMTGWTNGRMTLNLDGFVPISGYSEGTQTMVATLSLGDETSSLEQTTTMSASVNGG